MDMSLVLVVTKLVRLQSRTAFFQHDQSQNQPIIREASHAGMRPSHLYIVLLLAISLLVARAISM